MDRLRGCNIDGRLALAHGAERVKETGSGVGGVAWIMKKTAVLWGLLAAFVLGFGPASAAPQMPERRPSATAEAARPDPQRDPRPAIWLLEDGDTRIYLFGTVHILPPALRWRSAALERVIGEADELVMEVAEDPRADEDAALAPIMLLGKTFPVLQRVSPDRRAALGEMIAASGISIEAFDQMQTWAVAMTLAVLDIARAYSGDSGVPPEDLRGVEDALREDFAARNRPISGVETSAQQLGFFAGLPLSSQRALLESMVDAYKSGRGDILEPDGDGWVHGDVTRLATEMEQMPPELFEVLLVRRNTAWTQWLIDRLERPGNVLFAVGAGHLAGRASVQSMLEARGFTVRRLD